MKLSINRLLLAACFSLVCLSAPISADAVSADDLASYLGISSWSTVIDLPRKTYTVEIVEFEDGNLGRTLWTDLSNVGEFVQDKTGEIAPANNDTRLQFTFLAGVDAGKFKFTGVVQSLPKGIKSSQTVWSSTFKSMENWGANGLREKIKTGDYLLAAEMRPDLKRMGPELNRPAEEFVKDYKRGLVLRVKEVKR